jgi:hypothetical protein
VNIVQRILGEADDEEREKPEKKPEKETKPKSKSGGGEEHQAAEDSYITELANLWQTGNKEDLAQRFISLDNETCVKVVFALGRESALELARMVDIMLEQTGEEEAPMALPEEPELTSTEPARVEPPGEDNAIYQILGKDPGSMLDPARLTKDLE